MGRELRLFKGLLNRRK